MRMFRKDEGFTLVELMVVVLIIGILVAIAIPVFNSASGSAKRRTCQSNMRTIEGAVQQYVAADPTNLLADLAGSVDTTPLVPAYLKSAPLCPENDVANDYYVITGDSTVCPWNTTTHPHF